MIVKLSEQIEKRLEAEALARGVSFDTLIEQAIEAFLGQQPRRNAKGFIIPSFVGSVKSDDPIWIDRHEDLLWNDNGNNR
jgi:uncharacterized protein (UPF0297 family)